MPLAAPKQYELWADLARQNAHLRRNNYIHWAALLLLVGALVLVSFRPMAAVRVASDGSAEVIGPLTPISVPAPEEAEHVSRLVATHLLELTSGSVQRDLAKGMALMTASFQRVYSDRVMKDETLAAIEKGNVRSVLDFDAKATEIRSEKDDKGRPSKYFVQLAGRLRLYRADVLTAPLATRYLHIRTTLVVVPRGPKTLNGLLVEWFDKEAGPTPPGPPSVDSNPLSSPPRLPTLAVPTNSQVSP
jgi:hypothetical protein